MRRQVFPVLSKNVMLNVADNKISKMINKKNLPLARRRGKAREEHLPVYLLGISKQSRV